VLLKTESFGIIIQFTTQEQLKRVTGQIGFTGWESLWIGVIHIVLGPNVVLGLLSVHFQWMAYLSVTQ
jgi:hypothetical protein